MKGEHQHLEFDAESGTIVEVQSEDIPERFSECYVDDEGRVRDSMNGALLVDENYSVVGEKDGELDMNHSMGLSGGDEE